MLDKSKCIVLMPVGTHVEPETQKRLNQLTGYRIINAYGSSNVEFTRSQLASQVLDLGYEELIWIDSDIIFEVEDFEKLRTHDLPIVCGIYPKRTHKESDLNVGILDGTKNIIFGEGGGLTEILWCGTGFLYTKRCVYEDIRKEFKLPLCTTIKDEPFHPYFISMLTQVNEKYHAWLADDRGFCFRARQCGYKIYADTTIRLKHIGPYEYSWEDYIGPRDKYKTMKFDINFDD